MRCLLSLKLCPFAVWPASFLRKDRDLRENAEKIRPGDREKLAGEWFEMERTQANRDGPGAAGAARTLIAAVGSSVPESPSSMMMSMNKAITCAATPSGGRSEPTGSAARRRRRRVGRVGHLIGVGFQQPEGLDDADRQRRRPLQPLQPAEQGRHDRLPVPVDVLDPDQPEQRHPLQLLLVYLAAHPAQQQGLRQTRWTVDRGESNVCALRAGHTCSSRSPGARLVNEPAADRCARQSPPPSTVLSWSTTCPIGAASSCSADGFISPSQCASSSARSTSSTAPSPSSSHRRINLVTRLTACRKPASAPAVAISAEPAADRTDTSRSVSSSTSPSRQASRWLTISSRATPAATSSFWTSPCDARGSAVSHVHHAHCTAWFHVEASPARAAP